MHTVRSEWYADRRALHALATVLVDGLDYDVGALLDYMEKPWRWTPEYELWDRHGFPANDEDTWDTFVSALADLVQA